MSSPNHTSKCDFCDKPMVGYGAYHCAFYCEDHVADGERIEAAMWAEIEVTETSERDVHERAKEPERV